MTVAGWTWNNSVDSLACQLLSYADRPGIHMFQPEQSDRTMTIVNKDQGNITLVFSLGGEISHRNLPKWLWRKMIVRWFYAMWLEG